MDDKKLSEGAVRCKVSWSKHFVDFFHEIILEIS